MYGRKIKKKGSRGGSSGSAISNWGPRVALEAQQAEQHSKIYGHTPAAVAEVPRSLFKNPYGNNRLIYTPKYSSGACGGKSASEVKKPLTVIIPNQKPPSEKRPGYDYAYNNGRPEKRGSTVTPTHHSYDSLPSTETWRSSDDSDGERPRVNNNDENNNNVPRRQLSEMRSLPKDSETIEVSVSRCKTPLPLDKSLEYHESRLDLDSESSGASNLSIYSQQPALSSRQRRLSSTFGLNLVYVPMERAGKGSKLTPDRNSKAHEQGGNLEKSPVSPVLPPAGSPKDPDGDSLLESFDSILFKPHPRTGGGQRANSPGTSSGVGSSASQHVPTSDLGKSGANQALPPKNPPPEQPNKKNLRFSDHLDVKEVSRVIRQRSREPFCKCGGHGDTLDMDDDYLPCGHPKTPDDNYSTLSSLDSFCEGENGGQRSALQQLRDLSILIGGSFHGSKEHSLATPACQVLNSSASPSPPDVAAKLRKTSTTTATSGDSGKGSGQTPSASNRSSSSPGDCGGRDEPCIFRPDCKECLIMGLYRNPNEVGCRSAGAVSSKKVKLTRRKSKLIKNSKSKPKSCIRPSVVEIRNLPNGAECSCNCPGEAQRVEKSPEPKSIQGMRKVSPVTSSSSPSNVSMESPNLFTIEEEDDEYGVHREERMAKNNRSNNGPIVGSLRHDHPKCWLAPDPTMGWSDLESLYSQNMKSENSFDVNGECWTCWREIQERKRNGVTNNTIDRTKRMFIWLNKRPKEFNAPWWEAKKEASVKWILAKAYKNFPIEAPELHPYAETKKDKMRRLKDEVIRDLSNGKFYTMALLNLFSSTDPQYHESLTSVLSHSKKGLKLSLWEIIKILSRKGVYVAQPSDMKLTEGTLRQRKPLRIAAHIALIEAMMGLYASELLRRDRVIRILNSFGHALRPDVAEPEELVISWINSAVRTLQAYIRSTNHSNPPSSHHHIPPLATRWLHVTLVSEIRDLCDGVGISALFALYFSNDVRLDAISVPHPGQTLNLYEMTTNHGLIQRLCDEFFPEKIYHLTLTDFLYVHGYMKANILAFLVDLFTHLELNPIIRVNRLTHVPLRVQL